MKSKDTTTVRKKKKIKTAGKAPSPKDAGAKVSSGKDGGEKKEKGIDRNILRMTYIFIGLFLLLIGYLGYFLVFQKDQVISNAANKRIDNLAQKIVRGKILTEDGDVLAVTNVETDGTESRYYPYGSVFAHVVGYFSNGKAGLEGQANYYLLSSHVNVLEKIYKELSSEKNLGDDVYTTLDLELQQIAYDALGNRRGAVVVLEPSTGKILAMVSKPDFDPNTLSQQWDSLISEENTDANLLNRATSGLYPPGSTFKVVTALEYIRENPDTYNDFSFDCTGSITVENHELHCYHGRAHGHVNFREAFLKSCNSTFATLGLSLNLTSFAQTANQLLFNQPLPVDFDYKQSQFALNESSPTWEVMQTSFGQGNTLITPLHNAMLAAAIANDGVLMKPYLIDHVDSAEGTRVETFSPEAYGELLTAEEAEIMTQLMTAVVNEGTATKLKSSSYQAAGKTGTADFDSTKEPHSWFMGFASAENPTIAVSVIVEESGAGSTYAVPIAKKIFDAYFSR